MSTDSRPEPLAILQHRVDVLRKRLRRRTWVAALSFIGVLASNGGLSLALHYSSEDHLTKARTRLANVEFDVKSLNKLAEKHDVQIKTVQAQLAEISENPKIFSVELEERQKLSDALKKHIAELDKTRADQKEREQLGQALKQLDDAYGKVLEHTSGLVVKQISTSPTTEEKIAAR
jgi:septal ring factor EnvC (AmiA/AmiB activator)